MNPADNYRAKAAELDAQARSHANGEAASDCRRMASWYRRLAMIADRNSENDVTYETPSRAGKGAEGSSDTP